MSIVIDDKKITDINISNKNVQKIVDILTGKIIFEKTKPVSNEYFYIENTYNGSNTISLKTTIGGTNINGYHAKQLQYSKDKKTWTTIKLSGTNTIPMNSGEKVYFRNDSGGFNWYKKTKDMFYTQIKCSNNHKVGGNINSLLDYNNYNVAITPYCFFQLFYGNEYLTDANELIFPKTSLANNCYSSMFSDCTSLTTAPKLPATTLAPNCYTSMFRGCTKLTVAPELSATTLANSCYQSMFMSCTSLTVSPVLPATSLASSCYYYMFQKCTSLTTAPELPATTLASDCYNSMFSGCTSLTTAPELPATTLKNYCYSSMFSGCIGLTTAPELPATTLANECYSYMYQGCTKLTTAPVLPATSLASSCYQYMFKGCTSLTTSPVLPATTLISNCYRYMFLDCTSLNNVTSYADSIGNGVEYTFNWLSNVASSGTFRNLGSATYSRDASGIPSGWTEVKN